MPGRALARNGWDVAVVEDNEFDLPSDVDVVVICRIMGDALVGAVETLQRRGITVVYDTDDWFAGVPDYNPASKVDNTDVASMHEAMRRADAVTVSTPGLARLYGPVNDHVSALPNLLDPHIWDWEDNQRYRVPHDGVRVGWHAAYRWRGGDIEVLRPWLPRFLDDHPEVRFVAAGCPELADDLGIDVLSPPAWDTRYSSPHLRPYAHVPALVGLFDVGLVPLAYNQFNWSGKSACKAMECNAMGVPVVASPSEANRAYVRSGVNGLLVRKGEWVQRLEAVIADLDRYRKGAREVAERHYIDDHVHLWERVYEQARRPVHA